MLAVLKTSETRGCAFLIWITVLSKLLGFDALKKCLLSSFRYKALSSKALLLDQNAMVWHMHVS
jgi:hypothetical protein